MNHIPRIFIAYARKDAPLLDELRIHLKPLERSGRALIWYDGLIAPGEVWEAAIKENLHKAHIILLLVSADAIASDYFYETEMTDALARHAEGKARVVPLIVRPCAWRATPLAKLQALPKDGKPVSSWSDREDAWNDAVEALLQFIEQNEEETRLEKEAAAVRFEAQARAAEAEKQRKAAAAQLQKEEAERQHRRSLDPFADLMLPIEGGSFDMGSNEHDSEKPIHKVTVKDFRLCKFPVTQAAWKRVVGQDKNPSRFKGDDLPVEKVNWKDAQDFIQKLNAGSGQSYRLPSEAEWEFAARGGNKSKGFKFSGSNDLKEVGWFKENSGIQTQPVGDLAPNELGLHDMSGNVWEWCEDVWHENYQGAPANGRAWTVGGEENRRVLRGGSWGIAARLCRSSNRLRYYPEYGYGIDGFRVAQGW